MECKLMDFSCFTAVQVKKKSMNNCRDFYSSLITIFFGFVFLNEIKNSWLAVDDEVRLCVDEKKSALGLKF